MEALLNYGDGIYAFDAGYVRPSLAAIYLVVEGGRATLIESGTSASLPRAIEALAHLGLGPGAVNYVILTHVHLDHAAGAGSMLEVFPNAQLVVHPRGVRHMADPRQLSAAVAAVYGTERARELYGELIPVPVERIIGACHGSSIQLGARELQLLETPGHAKHHLCIRDAATGGIFTGDLFGLSYREFDEPAAQGGGRARQFIFPTTSPSQFDPDAMRASIELVMAMQPPALYPTHYGRLYPVPSLLARLHRMIDAHVASALAEREGYAEREVRIRARLAQLLLDELRDFGSLLPARRALELMETDLDLNAEGLVCWLDAIAGKQIAPAAPSDLPRPDVTTQLPREGNYA